LCRQTTELNEPCALEFSGEDEALEHRVKRVIDGLSECSPCGKPAVSNLALCSQVLIEAVECHFKPIAPDLNWITTD
jgi:hypothetical protein